MPTWINFLGTIVVLLAALFVNFWAGRIYYASKENKLVGLFSVIFSSLVTMIVRTISIRYEWSLFIALATCFIYFLINIACAIWGYKYEEDFGNLESYKPNSFELDRIDLPSFYTVRSLDNSHNERVGTIFAESDTHDFDGWVSMGYVSRQSPLGQGTYLGFKFNELRIATRMEVERALQENHPHGSGFRPACQEALDASFHLVLSKAFSNWTADTPSSQYGSALSVTRNEIREAGETAWKNHQIIMRKWMQITHKQIRYILQNLK